MFSGAEPVADLPGQIILGEECNRIADDKRCEQGSDLAAPEKESKKKGQYGMEGNSGGDADKCSDSNTARQDAWFSPQANESEVIISDGALGLNFH